LVVQDAIPFEYDNEVNVTVVSKIVASHEKAVAVCESICHERFKNMMKRICERASTQRLANKPWSESIRLQSRPLQTPKLPMYAMVGNVILDRVRLLPSLVGLESMESLLDSHGNRLRLSNPPKALRDSSYYTFSLLDTLQGKGGDFMSHPLGDSWKQTLQQKRIADKAFRDANSRAIVPYQGPVTTRPVKTLSVVTPIPEEWIMALYIAMAALQATSTSQDGSQPAINSKRKREPTPEPTYPSIAQVLFGRGHAKYSKHPPPTTSQSAPDSTACDTQVSFAQVAHLHHLEQSNQSPPILEGAFDGGGEDALASNPEWTVLNEEEEVFCDTSGPNSTKEARKRQRLDRKKERKAKRACKKEKKLEKKRKRSEALEQKAPKITKTNESPLPTKQPVVTAQDQFKMPPETLFTRTASIHFPTEQPLQRTASATLAEVTENELDKASATLMQKSRDKSHQAASKARLPHATGPSTLHRAPNRPMSQTVPNGDQLVHEGHLARAVAQRATTSTRPRSHQVRSSGPTASSSRETMVSRNTFAGSGRSDTGEHQKFPRVSQQGAAQWAPTAPASGIGQIQQATVPRPETHPLTKTRVTQPGHLVPREMNSLAGQGHGMRAQEHVPPTTVGNEVATSQHVQHEVKKGPDPSDALEHYQHTFATTEPSNIGFHRNSQEMHQQDPSDEFSRLSPLKLLCSEDFLETRGAVVAELASGRWAEPVTQDDTFDEGFKPPAFGVVLGRKVELLDTPLVDLCGIDIELSNRRAILIYEVSTMELPQQAREVVIGLAQLVAVSRYKHIDIILSYDVPVTSSISRHVVQMQTAIMGNDDKLSTSTSFKIASPASLSAVIAETAFAHQAHASNDPLSDQSVDLVNDDRVREWSRFLLCLLPSLSVKGALQCIELAQRISPSQHSFGLLFRNLHLRQQITKAATSSPCRAPEVHPCAMIQLSHILRVYVGKSPQRET